MMRTYTELCSLETFEERIEYLRLNGKPSEETFGSNRWINQKFYKSKEWLSVRNSAIVRDSGFDLGLSTRPILGSVYVHHMNPINQHQIVHDVGSCLDLEFLICVSFNTHQFIHYGRHSPTHLEMTVRTPNDTNLWEDLNVVNNSTTSKTQHRGFRIVNKFRF